MTAVTITMRLRPIAAARRAGAVGVTATIEIDTRDARLTPMARAILSVVNRDGTFLARSERTDAELMEEAGIAAQEQVYGDVLGHQVRDWSLGFTMWDPAHETPEDAIVARINEVAARLEHVQGQPIRARQ